MNDKCRTCKYAIWDYEDAFGGGYWFIDRCHWEHDIDPIVEECGDYEEEDEWDAGGLG